VHHLLLVLFLDHNILDGAFGYLDCVWRIYPYLCVCRTQRVRLSLHHSMSLNALDQQRVTLGSWLEVFVPTNANLWCTRLLLFIHLLQREVTNVFILRKYHTSLAVPWIFISAILLILRWIDSFNRWLLILKLKPLLIKLVVTINDLLLHIGIILHVWIYLRPTIIILVRQKVWRLIVRLNLLLSLIILLKLLISVLLLHLILTLILRCKLDLASILYYVLWLNV
jgi:hypothetical protein